MLEVWEKKLHPLPTESSGPVALRTIPQPILPDDRVPAAFSVGGWRGGSCVHAGRTWVGCWGVQCWALPKQDGSKTKSSPIPWRMEVVGRVTSFRQGPLLLTRAQPGSTRVSVRREA